MPIVTSKQEVRTLPANTGDAWSAFRTVEVLTLEWTQRYQHSLGKYSRFYIELENKRFYATRCPACQRIYAPPRPLCPACTAVTAWCDLAGTGTLETYAIMHFGSGANDDINGLQTPYILAYVLLDGASTLFPHILHADPSRVSIGMRVRVAYVDGPVQHPIHLMHFVPLEVP